MENTLENKAKFFAQYWGQSVMMEVGKRSLNRYDVGYLDEEREDQYLELKPLSQISDEDAIEISHIYDGNVEYSHLKGYTKKSRIQAGRDTVIYLQNKIWKETPTILYDLIMCLDYLRSKGYALPWMGLSVEQLIEYGWIKLKED